MGSNSDRALLLLDTLRKGKEDTYPQMKDALPYIYGELQYFRERGRPILHIGADASGEPAANGLTPRKSELLFPRTKKSALAPDVIECLRSNAVKRITLIGFDVDGSLIATAAEAEKMGFQVTVPEPCVLFSEEGQKDAAFSQLRKSSPEQA